jgi:hypothetical protein
MDYVINGAAKIKEILENPEAFAAAQAAAAAAATEVAPTAAVEEKPEESAGEYIGFHWNLFIYCLCRGIQQGGYVWSLQLIAVSFLSCQSLVLNIQYEPMPDIDCKIE